MLGIVEVMKLMSNSEAQFSGSISKILVDNEQAVEYGEPLLVIKRNGWIPDERAAAEERSHRQPRRTRVTHHPGMQRAGHR